MVPGKEVAIHIDQTLTQDATGTMSYLQFEAMGIPRVRTDVSVSYVDHNMLQTGFENADDHRFLRDPDAHDVPVGRPGARPAARLRGAADRCRGRPRGGRRGRRLAAAAEAVGVVTDLARRRPTLVR